MRMGKIWEIWELWELWELAWSAEASWHPLIHSSPPPLGSRYPSSQWDSSLSPLRDRKISNKSMSMHADCISKSTYETSLHTSTQRYSRISRSDDSRSLPASDYGASSASPVSRRMGVTTESTWMETSVDRWDLYTYSDTYETEARTIGMRNPEIHQTHWSKTVVILDKFHPSARYLG